MDLCIKVISRLPQNKLHPLDRHLPGDYHFTDEDLDEPELSAEDLAAHGLNSFHYQYAIKVLEDFDIFVEDEHGDVVEPNEDLEGADETLSINFVYNQHETSDDA